MPPARLRVTVEPEHGSGSSALDQREEPQTLRLWVQHNGKGHNRDQGSHKSFFARTGSEGSICVRLGHLQKKSPKRSTANVTPQIQIIDRDATQMHLPRGKGSVLRRGTASHRVCASLRQRLNEAGFHPNGRGPFANGSRLSVSKKTSPDLPGDFLLFTRAAQTEAKAHRRIMNGFKAILSSFRRESIDRTNFRRRWRSGSSLFGASRHLV